MRLVSHISMGWNDTVSTVEKLSSLQRFRMCITTIGQFISGASKLYVLLYEGYLYCVLFRVSLVSVPTVDKNIQ